MSIHKGDSPKNARIKINYTGKKPIVTFAYPCKHGGGTEGSMFLMIFMSYICIIFLAYFIFSMGLVDFNEGLYNTCIANNNFTERLECNDRFLEDDGIELLIPLALSMIFSMLTYYPFKKYWANVYPKWQAFQAKKKIKIFKPKDVQYTKELGYYCELPVFENIVLNFDATKGFSKHLREFEIEEHKFKYYRKPSKRKKLSKDKMRKQRDKAVNEWLWYARFYFNDKPQTGKLEVLFK